MPIKKDQAGFTLIEVVAALLIIGVVLLGFFYLFMNATTTTKKANEIFDATYYAQQEMEHLYQLSQSVTLENREQAITFVPAKSGETTAQYEARKIYYYSKIAGTSKFEKQGNKLEDANNSYYYELTCEVLPLKLTKIIVRVYERKGGVQKAQMESIYEWR